MGKKGPLWWRESDWLLRGSSAANQILLRHSGPILSPNLRLRAVTIIRLIHITSNDRSFDCPIIYTDTINNALLFIDTSTMLDT